jgi:hypothetical protein
MPEKSEHPAQHSSHFFASMLNDIIHLQRLQVRDDDCGMDSAPKTVARAPRPTNTGNDRRRGNRHRLNLPATITVEPAPLKKADPTPIAVTVTHFSVNGVAFRTGAPVVVGTVYVVACFDTLLPNNLRVRVVTQRELPGGGFEVGSEVV